MKNKILKILMIIMMLIISILSIWYYKYIYKYNQIAKFTNESNQEIYILGTYHGKHLNKAFNYSLQDITSVIKNINPDMVLIESREDTYKDYNVIDGPIDMIIAYSYCIQENIDIGMIDYWKLNDEVSPRTTDKKRDDIINDNIIEKIDSNKDKKKILIICGDTHFHEQIKRFKSQGLKKVHIKNKKELFHDNGTFKYPLLMQKTIEDKINYISTIFNDEILKNIHNDKNKAKWINNSNELIENLKKQLELVKENKLYY